MINEFKNNNFDLLRIFAATEVLLLHSFSHLGLTFPKWFAIMSYFPGVPMFFVMSGFLISASYERNNDLKKYTTNRISRIFPALWCCIILTVICIYLVANINFLSRQGVIWFVCQLVGLIYTPSFLSNYGFGSYNGSLWTIPIELQFYIVLPIIYYIIGKISRQKKIQSIIFGSVFILFLFVSLYLLTFYSKMPGSPETDLQKVLRYTFIPHLYLFLLGIFLYRLKAYQSKLIYNKGIIWMTIYFMVSFFSPDIYFFDVFQKVILGICTISLAYTLPGYSEKILKGNDISYGVYIYHGLIIGILVQLNLVENHLYVFVVFVASYSLSLLSWIFIEKPIMKRKKATIKNSVDIVPSAS